jgi:cation:H+ antiporter
VDGSSALARVFRVPSLVIGLTIVALGTSAPEFAVSTVAAANGSNEIAMSNVVGSNLFNLLVVLGSCAAMRSVPVRGSTLKVDFPAAVGPTLLLFVILGGTSLVSGRLFTVGMGDVVGTITWPVAIVLILVYVLYLFLLVRSAWKNRRKEEDNFGFKYSTRKCAGLILIGFVLIVAGGQAVVESAKRLAAALGMTETLIGLTVVSLGTSLPELVTSVVAARKGETELAVGNVMGSNIFNMLMITGVSAAIHPVAVNAACAWDLLILLVTTAMAWVFAATGKRINRVEGVAMCAAYAAVMAFAIIR